MPTLSKKGDTTTILALYLDQYQKYKNIFQNNFVVLIEIGCFYEVISIEKDNYIKGVADILGSVLCKPRNCRKYYFTGFPTICLNKNIDILKKNNQIVICLDREENAGPAKWKAKIL